MIGKLVLYIFFQECKTGLQMELDNVREERDKGVHEIERLEVIHYIFGEGYFEFCTLLDSF